MSKFRQYQEFVDPSKQYQEKALPLNMHIESNFQSLDNLRLPLIQEVEKLQKILR